MSLDNLTKTGQLKPHSSDRAGLDRISEVIAKRPAPRSGVVQSVTHVFEPEEAQT